MKRVLPIQIAAIYCLALVCAVPAFALSPPVQPLAKPLPIAVMLPPRINAAGAEIPIRLDSVSVTTEIAGRLAQTSVELVFFNPNRRQLEGELQFPLLDGQEVTGFAMDFNRQMREAVPVEKSRGQAVFEDITRVRVDPALAEKTIGNNFKLRVYLLFARIDPRLIRNLPLDLRAVLAWDADNTDIDLYVTDPNGDIAFFGNPRTFQGGRMSADFTGGYGPEEFSLKSAKPGKYRVEAQFYGHRQQVVAGATTLMLKLTTRFGTTGAREQLVTLRLKDAGSKVLVGEFEVGGS